MNSIYVTIGTVLYFGVAVLCNFCSKKLLNFNSSWLWLFWPIMLGCSIILVFCAGFAHLVDWLGNEIVHMIGLD